MPKKQHPVRAAARETRAIDHIGQPFFDRLEQRRIVRRIIFQVGILNQHDFAGHMAERGFERRALALIARLEKNSDLIEWILRPLILFLQARENLTAPILRAIVDENDLLRHRKRAHSAHDFLQRRSSL